MYVVSYQLDKALFEDSGTQPTRNWNSQLEKGAQKLGRWLLYAKYAVRPRRRLQPGEYRPPLAMSGGGHGRQQPVMNQRLYLYRGSKILQSGGAHNHTPVEEQRAAAKSLGQIQSVLSNRKAASRSHKAIKWIYFSLPSQQRSQPANMKPWSSLGLSRQGILLTSMTISGCEVAVRFVLGSEAWPQGV